MKNIIAVVAGLAVIGAAAAAISIAVSKKRKAEVEGLLDLSDDAEFEGLGSGDDSEGYIGYEGYEGDMKGIPFFSRLMGKVHHVSEEEMKAREEADSGEEEADSEEEKSDSDEEKSDISSESTIEELVEQLKEPEAK